MIGDNLKSGIDVVGILSKFPTKQLLAYDEKISYWTQMCSRTDLTGEQLENAKLELSSYHFLRKIEFDEETAKIDEFLCGISINTIVDAGGLTRYLNEHTHSDAEREAVRAKGEILAESLAGEINAALSVQGYSSSNDIHAPSKFESVREKLVQLSKLDESNICRWFVEKADEWIAYLAEPDNAGPTKNKTIGYGIADTEWIARTQEGGSETLLEERNRLLREYQFAEHGYGKLSGFVDLTYSPDSVLSNLWYYALCLPHDPEKFEAAKQLYNRYTEYFVPISNHDKAFEVIGIQTLLADLYVAKNMGEGVLRMKSEYLYAWLDAKIRGKLSTHCEVLASGLMWMKAYELETEVLRRMAAGGVLSDAKLQERLRFLESGGDKGPAVHDVEAKEGLLQFDYSSVSWESEDYELFFKNMAYENKKLEYALTVREWSKTLMVASKKSYANESLFAKIGEMIDDEYEDAVHCGMKQCEILADGIADEADGILLNPDKKTLGFDHAASFVSIIKIGKNLNIRIYTLFLPAAETLEKQTQQALSLKKNLNPNILAFENSLRESVLRVIESFINDMPDGGPGVDANQNATDDDVSY